MLRAFANGAPRQFLCLLAVDIITLVGSSVCFSFLASSFVSVDRSVSPIEVTTLVLFFLAAFFYRDLYQVYVYASSRLLFVRWGQCLALCFLAFLVTEGLLPEKQFGIIRTFIVSTLVGCSLLCWRFIFKRLMDNKHLKDRILILGSGDTAKNVARSILTHEAPGYEVIGFIGPKELVGVSILNPSVVGTYEDLPNLLRGENISAIVVAEENRRRVIPMDLLVEYRLTGGQVFDDTRFLEDAIGRVPISSVRPAWFVFSQGFNRSLLYLGLKRLIEIGLAVFLLLIHMPFLLAIALLIKIDSSGPILFRQRRVGKDGSIFWLYKFRSMKHRQSSQTHSEWAQLDDARITRVGRIIRRLRLDELPQLLNVLRGNMSLIGPRPEQPDLVEWLQKEIPHYGRRHTVKPGLTGWAQVSFNYGGSLEGARIKLEYDLYYVRHMSLFLDAFILLKTVKTVLRPDKGR